MSRTYRCVESKKCRHPKLLKYLQTYLNEKDNTFLMFHRFLRIRKPWRNIGDAYYYNGYKEFSRIKNRARQAKMLKKMLRMDSEDLDSAVFDSFRVKRYYFDPNW